MAREKGSRNHMTPVYIFKKKPECDRSTKNSVKDPEEVKMREQWWRGTLYYGEHPCLHSNAIHQPVWGLTWASQKSLCLQVGLYFSSWLFPVTMATSPLTWHRVVIGISTQKLGLPVEMKENNNKNRDIVDRYYHGDIIHGQRDVSFRD